MKGGYLKKAAVADNLDFRCGGCVKQKRKKREKKGLKERDGAGGGAEESRE